MRIIPSRITDREKIFRKKISHFTNTLQRPRQFFAPRFPTTSVLFLSSQAGRVSLVKRIGPPIFLEHEEENQTMTNTTMTNAATTNPNLSGGPRTPAGKFESSKNAIKHGLTAKSIDRFPAHLREEFRTYLEEQYEEHKPVTLSECDYLEQYAFNRYQLSRSLPMLMQIQDDLAQDPGNEALEKRFIRLNRHVKSLERSARHALQEMRNFISDRMSRTELLSHVKPEFRDQVDIPVAFPLHQLIIRKELRKPATAVLERYYTEKVLRTQGPAALPEQSAENEEDFDDLSDIEAQLALRA